MAATFDELVDLSHDAWGIFITGDPKPAQALYSRLPDVSNANPFGPVVLGYEACAATMDRAAGFYREGVVVGFDTLVKYVEGDIGLLVETERYSIKVGGADERSSVVFRATSIFRREGDNWTIFHRHADPIVTARDADSVIQS